MPHQDQLEDQDQDHDQDQDQGGVQGGGSHLQVNGPESTPEQRAIVSSLLAIGRICQNRGELVKRSRITQYFHLPLSQMTHPHPFSQLMRWQIRNMGRVPP